MAEEELGGDDGEAGVPQSTAYVIEGGVPLRGTVPISGAKNAVLKLMAAAVLCDEPCTIATAPRIADVECILEVLCDLGAEACWVGDHELRIHARQLDWDFIPLEAAKRLRASFVMLGPMLGRLGKVAIPNPGGDRIGRRPVNVHVDALRALGAEIDYKWGYYYARVPGGLRGADVRLAEASVTGTENVLMSAILAEGRTTICNAAAAPEVDNLIEFLNAMGGRAHRAHDRRRRRASGIAARGERRGDPGSARGRLVRHRRRGDRWRVVSRGRAGRASGGLLRRVPQGRYRGDLRAGRRAGRGASALPRAPGQYGNLPGVPDRSSGAVLAGPGRS